MYLLSYLSSDYTKLYCCSIIEDFAGKRYDFSRSGFYYGEGSNFFLMSGHTSALYSGVWFMDLDTIKFSANDIGGAIIYIHPINSGIFNSSGDGVGPPTHSFSLYNYGEYERWQYIPQSDVNVYAIGKPINKTVRQKRDGMFIRM